MTSELALIHSVREAAERLAARLRRRQAWTADLATCSPMVPAWWRRGLAPVAIFGDGLVSLPARQRDRFSRPVGFLSASEVSQTAGGEYVPLAWLDGGEAVALVHDRDPLPVVAAALDCSPYQGMGLTSPLAGDGPEAGEALADSLVEFLDALTPQTVCRFVARGARWTIELSGERSLRIERDGQLQRLELESDEAVGRRVASFVIDALDAGMHAAFCPAPIRRLIARRRGAVMSDVLPEVRAAAAIRRLIDDGSLELVAMDQGERDDAIEDLIDDAARFLERNVRRRNLVEAFAEWLARHARVEDLYADDDAVRDALTVATPEPGA